MDHNQAVQSQACEKYLLGELPPDLRDDFEEHFFSCAECAAELRAAANLLSNGRQVLAPERVMSAPTPSLPQPIPAPSSWLAWLKPAFSLPTFAALLLFLGYQNFVTIPRYRQVQRQMAAPGVLPTFSLIAANTRGDESAVFIVAPNQLFGVYVDLPADPAYATYFLLLETPSGASLPLRSLNLSEAQKTQVVTINPAHEAGKYSIIVSGLAAGSGDTGSAKELARLQFTVALKE